MKKWHFQSVTYIMCRELELNGKMASNRYSFLFGAPVKRTPYTQKLAGSKPGESDLDI
jgi:hypothetical protein